MKLFQFSLRLFPVFKLFSLRSCVRRERVLVMFLRTSNFIFFVILFSGLNASPQNQGERATNIERCGNPSQSTSLVINGNDFQRGTWPWMVALMLKTASAPKLFCGGVLVSSNKVLTGEIENIAKKRKETVDNPVYFCSCALYTR